MNTEYNLQIRHVVPSDIPALYQALVSMAKELNLFHRFNLTEVELSRLLFKEKIADAIILVDENDNLTGLAMYSITNRDFALFNRPGIYLHDLYVLPNYRKLGIATKLINQLKNIAKDQNLGRIDFVVGKHNANALSVYESRKDVVEVSHIKSMRILIEE